MNKELFVSVEELKRNAVLRTHSFESEELLLVDKAVMEALAKCRKYTKADVRGKSEWVEGGIGWKCSSCGYGVKPYNATYFCPNCGCEMKNGC